MWSGRRLTKRQVTSRPDQLLPELCTKLGRNAKVKERQKWSNEKPQLDNARRLRVIYFIDPEDKEFKETIRSARKKLEMPMAPAMPCKTSKNSKHDATRGKTNEFKSKLACILEASKSRRLCMKNLSTKWKQNLRVFWKMMNLRDCVWEIHYQNHHEDQIAGKRDNSLQHFNLVHNFIPMPQAMKFPAAKAAVDK